MLDPELLTILRCPETRQPLREAGAAFVANLNQRIAAGAIRNRAGQAVSVPCEGALLREDGHVAYPIRGRLPVLLLAEAIAVQND